MSRFQIRVNVTLRDDILLSKEDTPEFMGSFKQSLESRLNDSGLVSDAHIVEIVKEEKKLSLKERQKIIDEESAKLRRELKEFTKDDF